MKLTSTQLRRIIREEVQKVTEAGPRGGLSYPKENALRAAIDEFEAWVNENVPPVNNADIEAYHDQYNATEKLIMDVNGQIRDLYDHVISY